MSYCGLEQRTDTCANPKCSATITHDDHCGCKQCDVCKTWGDEDMELYECSTDTKGRCQGCEMDRLYEVEEKYLGLKEGEK